ncbi:MAG: type III secretion system export apparatus subunit SctR [Dongiaceae bacterium]
MLTPGMPDPLTLVIGLGALALVPFIAVMATSYVKIAVILSLVRNALGVQSIPPNMVLNGLAIILTVFVMAPVGQEAFRLAQASKADLSTTQGIMTALDAAKDPFKAFLRKRASPGEQRFFVEAAHKLWPAEMADQVTTDDFMVLVPAFTVSELTSAFEIGFLLYLPFIAIDLIISNILLAMGMMMVSPVTISLPLKLFLFVTVDGWTRLIHGLLLTYR